MVCRTYIKQDQKIEVLLTANDKIFNVLFFVEERACQGLKHMKKNVYIVWTKAILPLCVKKDLSKLKQFKRNIFMFIDDNKKDSAITNSNGAPRIKHAEKSRKKIS